MKKSNLVEQIEEKTNFDRELERIQELYSYHIVDTAPEDDFDELAVLAAKLLNCPVALITFVDSDIQYHKAAVGIDKPTLPREHTFCQYALYHPDRPFVVEDATKDERFKENPYVCTDTSPIVFYAGHPLVTKNGFVLGTLCIIDHKPRTISEEELHTLNVLARQVVKHLEARKVNRELYGALHELDDKHKTIVSQKQLAYFQARMAAVGQLAAGVGHEINNPLTVAKGKLRLLEKQIQTKVDISDIQNTIVDINGALLRIEKIVKGVKSFTTSVPDSLSTYDPIDVVKTIFQLHQEIFKEENIQFSLDNDITEDQKVFVEGDPSRLREVVLHLLSNAKDATEGQQARTVLGSLSANENHFILTIEDNGCGIPDIVKDKIFDPFYTTKEVDRGTGIGLSTCFKIIREEHRGNISFTTSPGIGSIFSVQIPLKK